LVDGRNRNGVRSVPTIMARMLLSQAQSQGAGAMDVEPVEITNFWKDAGADRWFKKDAAFDDAIRQRFLATHESAARGELMHWTAEPESALALILLLDQFPRNLFRDSGHAFATDQLGLSVARTALTAGHHGRCDPALMQFFFVPFMHSEALADQDLCVTLCREHGLQHNRQFAETHRDIIRRFGRFPHRNKVLGRTTTPEERAFLDAGGFAG
jgi:uncharacterized protein (DUF924 family)